MCREPQNVPDISFSILSSNCLKPSSKEETALQLAAKPLLAFPAKEKWATGTQRPCRSLSKPGCCLFSHWKVCWLLKIPELRSQRG